MTKPLLSQNSQDMKYIYYVIPFLLLIFIGVSLFYTGSGSKNNSKGNGSEFARGSIDSATGRRKGRATERSLFEEDSKFLEFPEVGIEEPDSLQLTPVERERRKKLIIEKSKKLAAQFPHNSIIPRELSKEEEKKLAETNQKMANVQNQFLQNEKVAKEDRLFYYKERLKTSKDRLEIFRYVLAQQNGGSFDESKLDSYLKDRYENFLENEKAYVDEIIKVEKE